MRTSKSWVSLLWMALAVATTAVRAEDPQVLRDLEAKNPRKLSKEEVTQLLPGAKMSRVSERGNTHYWTNEADGSFVISSDNRGANSMVSSNRSSTAQGKWHISDDGRYCVLIEWRSVPTEEWCRFILETTDGYYGVRSESVGTERVHKLQIKK